MQISPGLIRGRHFQNRPQDPFDVQRNLACVFRGYNRGNSNRRGPHSAFCTGLWGPDISRLPEPRCSVDPALPFGLMGFPLKLPKGRHPFSPAESLGVARPKAPQSGACGSPAKPGWGIPVGDYCASLRLHIYREVARKAVAYV